MFKPKKQQTIEEVKANMIQLPTESEMRPLSGIKDLMTQAKEHAGSLIEFSWTTDKPLQRYILTVQWEKASTNPTWSLYEENEKEYKNIWSQSWSPADLELMYDTLMVCTGTILKNHAKIPDILKPENPPFMASETPAGPTSASNPFLQATPFQQTTPFPVIPQPVPPVKKIPGEADAPPNILLGTLLTEAQVISEQILEVALKMQELVRQGKIPSHKASEMLKPILAIELAAASAQEKKPEVKPSAVEPKLVTSELDQHQALDLLNKAGLLSPVDIAAAKEACTKLGGTVVDILKMSDKLKDTTMEAALICSSMIANGAMKVEQCVLVLDYVGRSRVSFDEALAELNWPNPRLK